MQWIWCQVKTEYEIPWNKPPNLSQIVSNNLLISVQYYPEIFL